MESGGDGNPIQKKDLSFRVSRNKDIIYTVGGSTPVAQVHPDD